MAKTVHVTFARWCDIRGRFTSAERAKLNAAIVGETICPRGVVVDVEQLSAETASKLQREDNDA